MFAHFGRYACRMNPLLHWERIPLLPWCHVSVTTVHVGE